MDAPDARILKAFESQAETITQIQTEETGLAQQVLKDFPDNEDAYILAASVYREHGDSATATEYLERALKIDPRRAEAYEELGAIAKEKGNLDQAVAHWERGLKAFPEAPGLRWCLAEAAARRGNHERALELLEAECRITPGAARNYYLRGQIYGDLGRYDQARQDYEKVIAINPRHYNAYYALGTMCLKLKETEQARKYLSRFQDLRNRYETHIDERDKVGEIIHARARAASFYWRAHNIYSNQRWPRAAVQLMERAMHLDPTNASYLEGRAVLAYAMDDIPGALQLYQRARQVDPDNVVYYLNVGKLSARLRQLDDAQRIYEEAVTRFPEEHLAQAALARFYLQSQRRLPEAMALAQTALSLKATAENYFLVSWACSANRDFVQAAAAIQAALEMEPDNAKYKDLYEYIKSWQSSSSARQQDIP